MFVPLVVANMRQAENQPKGEKTTAAVQNVYVRVHVEEKSAPGLTKVAVNYLLGIPLSRWAVALKSFETKPVGPELGGLVYADVPRVSFLSVTGGSMFACCCIMRGFPAS